MAKRYRLTDKAWIVCPYTGAKAYNRVLVPCKIFKIGEFSFLLHHPLHTNGKSYRYTWVISELITGRRTHGTSTRSKTQEEALALLNLRTESSGEMWFHNVIMYWPPVTDYVPLPDFSGGD